MIRVLVLISIAGFLAGAVALGAAFALAGPELAARNWNWTIGGHDWSGDGDRPSSRIETVAEPDADDSRELAWDGSTHAAFALPASIEYVQGAGAKVVVTGPREAVAAVVLKDGRLSVDPARFGAERLHVVITAPNITKFEIGGDNRLKLSRYRQDRLEIDAEGAAEVTAEGEVRALDIELSGSSRADLSGLAAASIDAEVSGAAEADLAPRDSAKLEISGSGAVRLSTRPKRLETDIAGAGTVSFADGEGVEGGERPVADREARSRGI